MGVRKFHPYITSRRCDIYSRSRTPQEMSSIPHHMAWINVDQSYGWFEWHTVIISACRTGPVASVWCVGDDGRWQNAPREAFSHSESGRCLNQNMGFPLSLKNSGRVICSCLFILVEVYLKNFDVLLEGLLLFFTIWIIWVRKQSALGFQRIWRLVRWAAFMWEWDDVCRAVRPQTFDRYDQDLHSVSGQTPL